MSAISDKIISAGIELGEQIAGNVSNWHAQEQTMRDLIAAALADARREGAKQMRAESAKLTRKEPLYYSSGEPAEEELAQAIEDLPMPDGERQAVLLTRRQINDVMTKHYPLDSLLRENVDAFEAAVRDVESDVLAANNLEVRRG